MNPHFHHDITQRLLRDYEFKEQGEWLRKGRCPQCHKKELYTHAAHPWVLKCPRENHCGWLGHVKDLYPEIFRNWSDRFQSTPEDPKAAATAYLQMARGLNTAALGDCYTQESYYSHAIKKGSATVRFTLPNGSYWERLIDQPEQFDRKANFGGEYGGYWWAHPIIEWEQVKRLWLVEGIFDSIALRQHNITAVSLMSCGNYPEKSLAELEEKLGTKIPLVIALDGDKAGRKATLKMVERARAAGWECQAAQIPQRGKHRPDWNDLHLMPPDLTTNEDQFSPRHLAEYFYQGALLIAESAAAKALCMYKHTHRGEFWFFFRSTLYWYKFDEKKFQKAREEIIESLREGDSLSDEEVRDKALERSGGLNQIAPCAPTLLYFQRNPITDESWYFTRIDYPNRPSTKATFTASQLATAPEFKKRLMHVFAGGHFSGTTLQLDTFVKDQQRGLKTVETIDYIGYSRDHECWIFDKLAVKNGSVTSLNEEDFFDFGSLSVKSLISSINLKIEESSESYTSDWLPVLWSVFREKGLIALTFWFGSLFAEQIRSQYESYPFLELIGEQGAGKTTLVKFLWKLMGRVNYEGFDPSKASNAGRSRNFAQVSGLPVVLIEGDRDEESKYKRFDYEELKSVFNGNPIRSLGMKTGGNETYEPPFRGSIVIEQNAPVNASDAILSRIVHMHFDKKAHTESTNQQAKQLERWPLEKLSHFILAATLRERDVLATVAERFKNYCCLLQQEPRIREFRIVQNHAMMMALFDALALVVPNITGDMIWDVQAALTEMAVERQQSINADHPFVQEFWDAYDFMNGTDDKPRLNHSREPGIIAINLNHFYEQAALHHQRLAPMAELKRYLKTSRQRKYMDQRVVNSRISTEQDGWNRSMRCWVFSDEQTTWSK